MSYVATSADEEPSLWDKLSTGIDKFTEKHPDLVSGAKAAYKTYNASKPRPTAKAQAAQAPQYLPQPGTGPGIAAWQAQQSSMPSWAIPAAVGGLALLLFLKK